MFVFEQFFNVIFHGKCSQNFVFLLLWGGGGGGRGVIYASQCVDERVLLTSGGQINS